MEAEVDREWTYPVEVTRTPKAGWGWRCWPCDETTVGLAMDVADLQARTHSDTDRHLTELRRSGEVWTLTMAGLDARPEDLPNVWMSMHDPVGWFRYGEGVACCPDPTGLMTSWTRLGDSGYDIRLRNDSLDRVLGAGMVFLLRRVMKSDAGA